MNKLVLSALVTAGLATAMPLSLAQGATEGAGPQARPFAHRQHDGQRALRSPTERVEARLARLKTALKITEGQEAQWSAYAEVRRKHAREVTDRMQAFRTKMAERQQGARISALERLERRQAMLAAASARLAETLEATRSLYIALSTEQQQLADELLAPRGPRGRGGHRGRA